jgi:hypothetical protein
MAFPKITGEFDELGPLTQAFAEDYREEAATDALRCRSCAGPLTLHRDYERDMQVGRCACGQVSMFSGEVAYRATMDRAAAMLREKSRVFGTARRVELGEM